MKWGVGNWCCFVLCPSLFLLPPPPPPPPPPFFYTLYSSLSLLCSTQFANLNMQNIKKHKKHVKLEATQHWQIFFSRCTSHTHTYLPILWDSGLHWTWDRSADLSFNRPDLKFTSDLYWLFRSVEFGPDRMYQTWSLNKVQWQNVMLMPYNP